MRSKKFLAIASAAAAVVSNYSMFTTPAHAANGTWSATPTDSLWSNSVNWVGGIIPGSTPAAPTNATDDTSFATFDSALSGGLGGTASPVTIDVNRFIRGMIFDGAAGEFQIGDVAGQVLRVRSTGSITMNAGVANSQYINAPLQVRPASSTNGAYSFTNNSTVATAGMTIAGALTSGNGRVITLNLGGTNTATNYFSGAIVTPSTTAANTIINKTGVGTWVISGTNSFVNVSATTLANGVQISGGKLVAANNLAFGNTANTRVSVNNTGTLEVADSIALDNALVLHLYSGGAILGNGVAPTINSAISVGNAGATSATLATSGATGVFTVGNAVNDITGGATDSIINVAGSGLVSLGFSNNYRGAWSVNSGTLRAGAADALGATTSASLRFGASSTGIFQAYGANHTITGLNSDVTPGTPIVENGAGGGSVLTINNSTTSTYAGTIRDGSGGGTLGLVKGSSGVLVLSGSNDYTGGTTINGGTLKVTNTTGSALGSGAVALNSGTLAGTGRIGGAVTAASGTSVAMNDSGIGTLTMLGGLSLASSTSLTFELTATASDLLDVSATAGGLTINGGAITFLDSTTGLTYAPVNSGTYYLMKYSGGSIGGTGVSALSTAGGAPGGYAYTYGTALFGGATYVTLNVAQVGVVSTWNNVAGGTWATGSNWSPVGVPSGAGANVVMGPTLATSGGVTLDGARTVGNLTFNNPVASYDIQTGTGGTLTLDNNGSGANITTQFGTHTISAPVIFNDNAVVDVTTGQTLTVSGNISDTGTHSLTKISGGTLILTGSNTFAGALNLNGGTTQFADISNLGTSSLSFSGSTLKYATGNTADISSKTVLIGFGGATIDTNGNTVTFANSIGSSGAGGLTKSGAGTLTLAASNSYQGATTVNGGVLSISANDQLGDPTTGGSLTLQNGSQLSTTATMNLDNGTVSRAVTLGSGGGIINTAPSTTFTVTGTLMGSGSLTKNGDGTLTLLGNNTATYSGNVTIAAGTVALHNDMTQPSGVIIPNPNTQVANGQNAIGTGTITFNGGTLNMAGLLVFDVGTSSDFGNLTNAIVVPAGQTGTINMPKRGRMSGAVTGAGTLNVNTDWIRADQNGNYSAFTGQINFNRVVGATGGDVRINNGNGFGNAKVFIGDDTSVFQVFNPPTGTGTQTVQNIGELSGSSLSFLGGNPINGRYVNWTVGALNTTSTFAGRIVDSGGAPRLTKVGTGLLILTNSNSFSGNVTVSAGTLQIDNNYALGSSAAITFVAGEGTTVSGGTLNLNGASVNEPFLLSGGALVNNATASATVGSSLVRVNMTGSAGLGYSTPPSITISGGTTGTDATAAFSGVGTDGSATGGTLTSFGSGYTSLPTVTIESGIGELLPATAVASAFSNIVVSGTASTVGGTGTLNLDTFISGTGSFTKVGSGTTVLSFPNNTYSGTTTISDGVLSVTATEALGTPTAAGTGGTVIGANTGLTAAGTLQLSNNVTESDAIQLNGRQAPYATTVHILNASGTNTLTGNITANTGGNQYNIQSDAGTLVLNGSYTQTAGTLDRFLNLQGAGNGEMNGAISDGTGVINIVKSGAGTWKLGGSNTYSGPTTVNAGVLNITGNYAPATPATASLTINGSSVVNINAATATFATARGSTLNVTNGGSMVVAASDADGAGPGLRGAQGSVVKLSSLTIDGTSKLDLKNNGLIIPAAGNLNGSAITVDTLRAAIIAGRGGVGTGAATWSGAGGIGTSVFAFDETFDSIGYCWTGDPNLLVGPTDINGEAYDSGDYVVKYCAGADADLNGLVDDTDVAVIGLTYDGGASTGHHWYEGDFNYDGLINDDDVAIIGLAYNPGATPLSPSFYAALSAEYGTSFASAFAAGAAGTVVPEPASLGLLAVGAMGLLRRRRK